MDGEVEKRAILYSMLTAVEAVMDIVAMLVKDIGLEVGDDYTNISKLLEEGIIREEEAELLRKFRFRGAIAHHYNHLDLAKVAEAVGNTEKLYNVAVKLVKKAETILR